MEWVCVRLESLMMVFRSILPGELERPSGESLSTNLKGTKLFVSWLVVTVVNRDGLPATFDFAPILGPLLCVVDNTIVLGGA